MAQDPQAAEVLIRSGSPEMILAVAPALGQELLRSWTELAPQAEVRVIEGFIPLLEERVAQPKELLGFTIRSLSVVSGMVATHLGAPASRTSQILHFTQKAAESLGFRARDLFTAELSAVLSELTAALRSEESAPEGQTEKEEGPLANRRRRVADFAEALGCPLPIGAEPPPQRAGLPAPGPEEVVDAACRLVLLLERKAPDPALALRRLAVAEQGAKAELHPAAVEAALSAFLGEGKRTRAQIFIVDNDSGPRNLLGLRLGNEGYSVRTSGDGRRALEEIRREAPSLIISETVLPGLDGYALLDALKREGKGSIPYLFVSSRVDPLSVNKGLLLGAQDFLSKPVNFEVLLTKLEKILAQSVDLRQVTARLSLSDVTQGGTGDYPSVRYEELQPGVVILGRFRLEADLGEGGMGRVFKARDEKLEEQVVLKIMKPGFADDVLRRFKREIRLARKITHPGVVRIFDFWEAGSLKFVTMEFLEGSNLREEIKRRGAFPIPVAVRVAGEILEALAAAHEVGVIHRDIKPHNVLMLPSGRIKVLDFGIAQGLEPEPGDAVTIAGSIVGTPEYMSPEQLMAQPLDPRTDLYSAGVLLYELLTGEPPFRSPDRVAAAQMRLSSDPQPPSLRNPKVPPPVDTLVLRLLKRNPDDRFPSAQEAASAFLEIRR